MNVFRETNYDVLKGDSLLSDDELGMVLGGNASDVTGANNQQTNGGSYLPPVPPMDLTFPQPPPIITPPTIPMPSSSDFPPPVYELPAHPPGYEPIPYDIQPTAPINPFPSPETLPPYEPQTPWPWNPPTGGDGGY